MSAEIVVDALGGAVAGEAGGLLERLGAALRAWTITDRPPSISQVLAIWRQAERDLEVSTPGSESWNEASERFLVARAEYQRLFSIAAAAADELRRL